LRAVKFRSEPSGNDTEMRASLFRRDDEGTGCATVAAEDQVFEN
jgi:hypothetical protein